MVDVDVSPFEVEVRGRTGDLLRADVYLPANGDGPHPIVLGASPYQKALRHLSPNSNFPFRVELLPMSFLARRGDRIRLEITNQDSLIADAPMTHFYGQKVGADTYHHDGLHPSSLRLHERPRP